jgi:hypothetical protein
MNRRPNQCRSTIEGLAMLLLFAIPSVMSAAGMEPGPVPRVRSDHPVLARLAATTKAWCIFGSPWSSNRNTSSRITCSLRRTRSSADCKRPWPSSKGRDSPTPRLMARFEAKLGRRPEAMELVRRLTAQNQGVADPQSTALTYFALGDKRTAFDWLTRAFDQHHLYIMTAKVSPDYDEMRGDPRFEALIARLNLPN